MVEKNALMDVIGRIKTLTLGRNGNMSKRLLGESDDDFSMRLKRLAEKDLKCAADVYVATGITNGIAGFYVEHGDPIKIDGFKRAIHG